MKKEPKHVKRSVSAIGWQITGKLESGQTAVTDDNGLIVSK